ncbi:MULTISPECIES: hypothetical protein [unclassified Streptomyces]|uniref:hypothetical protein n=1 Tax=unclassified Streptomyces TaxID=2593676 RepID=UPI0036EC6A46
MSRPWRDRLKTAAELLRTVADEKAAQGAAEAAQGNDKAARRHSTDANAFEEAAMDVEAVLAPGGWNWLRETQATQSEMASMGLTIDRRLKDALSKAAEDTGTMPSAAVVKGFQAFVEGRFVPPEVKQTRGSAGYSKTTLTVTFPKALQAEVRARIPQVAEKAGYRITLSSIAIEWLLEELGVERPSD